LAKNEDREESRSQSERGRGKLVQPGQPLSIPWWRTALAGTFAVVVGIGLLFLIWLLARPLALIILGMAIAASLAPIVAFLQKWLPRVVAVLIVYLLFLAFLVGVILVTIPAVVVQVEAIAERAPEWIEQIQNWLVDLDLVPAMPDLIDRMLDEIGRIARTLVAVPLLIISGFFEIFLVLVISIYFLLEGPAIERFVRSLFPEGRGDRVVNVLKLIAQAMGGFVRGVAINAFAIGVLAYIGLSIIGLDFALVLGLMAGVFEIIPYLGPILAAIPILIVAFLDSVTTGLITLAFIVVLQQFESYVLTPNVMKTQTRVTPLLVVLALVLGGALGGLLGVLVAVPLAAALKVLVDEVAAPAIRERSGADEQEQVERSKGGGNDESSPEGQE
jgi:predicted PurR-regulated permease PerM